MNSESERSVWQYPADRFWKENLLNTKQRIFLDFILRIDVENIEKSVQNFVCFSAKLLKIMDVVFDKWPSVCQLIGDNLKKEKNEALKAVKYLSGDRFVKMAPKIISTKQDGVFFYCSLKRSVNDVLEIYVRARLETPENTVCLSWLENQICDGEEYLNSISPEERGKIVETAENLHKEMSRQWLEIQNEVFLFKDCFSQESIRCCVSFLQEVFYLLKYRKVFFPKPPKQRIE